MRLSKSAWLRLPCTSSSNTFQAASTSSGWARSPKVLEASSASLQPDRRRNTALARRKRPVGSIIAAPNGVRSNIAASIASCSRLSWRAVMSRVTLAKPRSSPEGPRSAVIVTSAQKRVPSLRSRQPSPWCRPSRSARASAAAGSPASRCGSG